jgi:alkylated DNA repair dioxygenase AlkB
VIEGLVVLPDFISLGAELALVRYIDSQAWFVEAGQRDAQHYGWRCDYLQRALFPAVPFPPELSSYCFRLCAKGLFGDVRAQIIINNNAPGGGISAHIDHVFCFEPVVASLSLLSNTVMLFRPGSKSAQALPKPLARRSLLVLRGGARYGWYHEIRSNSAYQLEGEVVGRKRRISMTIRTVNTFVGST